MKKRLSDVLQHFGLDTTEAVDHSTATDRIVLYLPLPGARVLVGTLTKEGDDFVFQYSDAFRARLELRPLPDFPRREHVYRSRELWPFFQTRLPPAKRPDVAKMIETRRLDPKNTLQMLGQLGRETVTSPYVLELKHAS